MATTQDLSQLIIEESPRPDGAATTTPYRLSTNVFYLPGREIGFQPGRVDDDRSDEFRGYSVAVSPIVDSYSPTGAFNMRAYANYLVPLLMMAGWDFVHTAGDGVILDPDGAVIPAGAHRWVGTRRSSITAKTAQITNCYADEGQWYRVQGAAITHWTLNPQGEFAGDAVALVMKRLTVDPNLTPVIDALSIPSFRRGDLTITGLSGSSAPADFGLDFTNPVEPTKGFGTATASDYPDTMEVTDADLPATTGAIPKKSINSIDFDAFMNGATFAMMAKWKTQHATIGVSGYPFSLWVDLPNVGYNSATIPTLKNTRRYPLDLGFKAYLDSTAGYDAKITVVNGIAAYETLV